MILGYLFVGLAALASGTGSVLESIGIQKSGAFGGDSSKMGMVAKQPLYWAGLVVDVLGFLLSTFALHRLPLFLVQSVMAFSVGVTATITVLMGVRLGRHGWTALAIASVGLVAVGFSAQPAPAPELPPGWRWILIVSAAAVCFVGIVINRTNERWTAPVLGFLSGLGFSGIAIAARTLHIHGEWWNVFLSPNGWAIGANGFAGAFVLVMALQKGNATTVSATMFTTNTVIPSAVGLILLHDTFRPGWAVPGFAGFIIAIAAAIAVARYSSMAGVSDVGKYAHPPQRPGESDQQPASTPAKAPASKPATVQD